MTPRRITPKRGVSREFAAKVERRSRSTKDRPPAPIGLGDKLAIIIQRTGAKWLYLKVRRLLYTIEEVDGGCGGCRRRQEKLNRFGRWVAKWWRRITFWRRKPAAPSPAPSAAP